MNPIGTEKLPLFGSPEEDCGSLDDLKLSRWSKLKRQVLALYGDSQPRIPDEAAWEVARDYMDVRPRCSELHTEGLLRFTGRKRKARRGMGKELVVTERGLRVLQLLKSDAAA